MQLLFKQRLFSWFDSYDIYHEDGSTAFSVKSRMDWGHRLEISDHTGCPVATLREKVLSFLPRFDMIIGDNFIGSIKKKLTLFKPVFTLDCNGWEVRGDIWEWNYEVDAPSGTQIMRAAKEIFNWTDTYIIQIADPQNALLSLMIVLAIDAAKCSKND
ncbi:MAG: LURP-one-related family protein [Oscillospiraceae bacterium]|jgi:uncharacterized protein YxjI|nr:LURP-one-related family protein [Oscillospiraceae bacterium]